MSIHRARSRTRPTSVRAARSCALAASGLWLIASAALAQSVAYVGTLRMGYSDADNIASQPINSAIPACAGAGPLVNPGALGTLSGTLRVTALGAAGVGPGAPLTFDAVGGSHGGAQQKRTQTCRSTFDVEDVLRLRSHRVTGSANWPGRRGLYTSMIESAPVPTSPVATYMLGALGGNTHPITVSDWTTQATWNGAVVNHTGAAFSRVVWDDGDLASPEPLARVRVQPGGARFGGAAPFSGKAARDVGVALAGTAGPSSPPPYGLWSYATGPSSLRPSFIGTKAQGVEIVGSVPDAFARLGSADDVALISGRHDRPWKVHTPGGSTILQEGAVLTYGGGNTQTPSGTFMSTPFAFPVDCVLTGCPIVSAAWASSALGMPWTTGAVTATDRFGDFVTIRRAAGYDVAINSSTAVMGETRRIQLVSPWLANSRAFDLIGLSGFLPKRFVAGVAVLTVNVIPIGRLEDFDADLVPFPADNCKTVPNGPNDGSHQIDTDHDGYGNACDADYTGDFLTTTADFTNFIDDFVEGRLARQTDHTGDGLTTTLDFSTFLGQFTGTVALGPGLACAGLASPCLPPHL